MRPLNLTVSFHDSEGKHKIFANGWHVGEIDKANAVIIYPHATFIFLGYEATLESLQSGPHKELKYAEEAARDHIEHVAEQLSEVITLPFGDPVTRVQILAAHKKFAGKREKLFSILRAFHTLKKTATTYDNAVDAILCLLLD